MTEIYRNQVARLKHTIQAQDVMLFQCMKYIQAIKAEVDNLAKLPICFGSYRIVDHGKIKNVEMRGDYDCRIIILKNTETNLITLDIDALETMAELREIRFHFVKKYVPGINTTIHLVNMGEPMSYIDFIYWCSQRRIRLSMTIGGEAVAVDWKYVFM
jgi:hypothetical protein